MKKKTGKVNQIATGFAAVLLGFIVAGTGTKVFANNNSDTYEYFSFSGDNTVHSDFRRKDDTTSSWCKCFNASTSCSKISARNSKSTVPAVTNQNFMSQYMEQVNITTHRAVIVDVGHMYLEKIKNGICGIRFMKHMEMTHIQRHI